MHGSRFHDPGATRTNHILDGIEQSQARIERLLEAGEFELALATSEELYVAIQGIDMPAASITAKDLTRLSDLVRRIINCATEVSRLMDNARSARLKSQVALKEYKKY